MPLFERHRASSTPPIPDGIPGLADILAARGFQRVTGRLFDGHLEQSVHDAAPTMHGFGHDVYARKVTRFGETDFGDAFRGTIDGRTVTVANGWTLIGPELRFSPGDWKGVAVCAVEMSTILPFAYVQSRRFHQLTHFPAVPTGNAAFDERFLVCPVPTLQQTAFSDDLLAWIMVHDDWAFRGERYLLGCLSSSPFRSTNEVTQRIDEVMQVVAAFPAAMQPAHVDHSEDDLIARIGKLKSIEDTMAFLQQVTPEDRARLAKSDTPLAAFADVRTPQEAQARFVSLDQASQMQVMAMFMKVKDDQGQR